MQGYFFIVCLKYVPGMWQHMKSFGGRFLRQGPNVRFLIAPEFQWMNKRFPDLTNCVSVNCRGASKFRHFLSYLWFPRSYLNNLFRQYPPSGLLLVSWHPLNFALARMVKSIDPKIPIIVWLHEPYKDEKKLYGTKALFIYLVELCQTLSLRYVDVVILHSDRALRMFEKRYPKFQGRKYRIPLQFEDDGFDNSIERRYISFLGRADRAKGIEEFFALVKSSAQEADHLAFQIVTSSNIDHYLNSLSSPARRNLRVINKPQISDADLREGAASSIAVLALYKETMQSGVIPVALMKGTPIIGTDIEGITEWIKDGVSGVIVSEGPSPDEIVQATTHIKANFKEMTQNCRAEYLATFDDGNWEAHYGWLQDLIR